jgi:hypothetical protein
MTGERTRGERIEALEALLAQTGEAHGRFEETELKGVYDQGWPRWYAAYAVEHGIGALVGHEVTTDRLATFLARSNIEFEGIKPAPTETWAAYTARRIAAEL